MIKYYNLFLINKKNKSVKKNNFLTYKKYIKFLYSQKKKFFYKSKKLDFKKRFITNSYSNKKNKFTPLKVCNLSGKYRATINKIWLKKHMFKQYLTFNLISSFFKKSKYCIIFLALFFSRNTII